MSHVTQYLNHVASVIHKRDGRGLRALLRLDSGEALQAVFHKQLQPSHIRSACDNKLDALWSPVLQGHLAALVQVHEGQHEAAFAEYAKDSGPALAFVDVLREYPDEAWIATAFEQILASLRQLAEAADEQLRRALKKPVKMEACGGIMQNAFSRLGVAKGSGQEGRRRGSLALCCALMRVYFKLNNISGCTQVAKTVRTAFGGDDLKEFPAPYRVAYHYYLGRIELYQENFLNAVKHLSTAFADCLARAVDHKRKILRYLVPIKMLLGWLPADDLLDAYALPEYKDIKNALAAGDVGLLTRTLRQERFQFVKAGTFLLLEKLQFPCYRRLIKKCQAVQQELAPSKGNQVPLTLLQGALAQQGVDKDVEELQCIVANLIVRDYVRGYIAFKQGVVVVSKGQPFPAPSEKWLRDPI